MNTQKILFTPGLVAVFTLLCGCLTDDLEPESQVDERLWNSKADGFGGSCPTDANLDGSVYCNLENVSIWADFITRCLRGGGGRSCLVDEWSYCSFYEIGSNFLIDDVCDLSDLYACLCAGYGGGCVDRCAGVYRNMPYDIGAESCPTDASLDGVVFCDVETVRINTWSITTCMRDGGGRECFVDDQSYCSFDEIPSRSIDDVCDLRGLYACLCGANHENCLYEHCAVSLEDDPETD
jgi:hypothetical protein